MTEQVAAAIGGALDGFGGVLKCSRCPSWQKMHQGDAGRYTAEGWPKCHGYTMTWWTQSQIDSGEMAAAIKEKP